MNGSKALKLIPLLMSRAIMPKPIAKAMPNPNVGMNAVRPLVIGIKDAPITWQITEVATRAMMLGVNVAIVRISHWFFIGQSISN